jgi:hypothetical protein
VARERRPTSDHVGDGLDGEASNFGFADLTELFESVVASIGEHTLGGFGQPGRGTLCVTTRYLKGVVYRDCRTRSDPEPRGLIVHHGRHHKGHLAGRACKAFGAHPHIDVGMVVGTPTQP